VVENKIAAQGIKMKKLTPIKAIRAKCLDCSGGSSKEVRLCPAEGCPLWPYRFGKRPLTTNENP